MQRPVSRLIPHRVATLNLRNSVLTGRTSKNQAGLGTSTLCRAVNFFSAPPLPRHHACYPCTKIEHCKLCTVAHVTESRHSPTPKETWNHHVHKSIRNAGFGWRFINMHMRVVVVVEILKSQKRQLCTSFQKKEIGN